MAQSSSVKDRRWQVQTTVYGLRILIGKVRGPGKRRNPQLRADRIKGAEGATFSIGT